MVYKNQSLASLYLSTRCQFYKHRNIVVAYRKLACNSLNLDTTSFHVDDQYEHDIDAQAIHIARGYSRDHRPDLNQVLLSLITENLAGIINDHDLQSYDLFGY